MTISKAKMYRTAIVAEDYEMYRKGDVVGVTYIGKGAFAMRFRVNADYLGKPEICMEESQLERFTL